MHGVRGQLMDDEWHIRIDKQYVDPQAGAGARAKAAELSEDRGGVRRFVERLLGVQTADRSWRRGAIGEERVAALLDRSLGDGWVVVHDLTIGSQGANLDHLVIGPAGVFALNTKHLKGNVVVYDRAILHNGTNYRFLPKARAEAQRVRDRLSAATGLDVRVQSVLVWSGSATVTVKGRPADVRSVHDRALPRWLRKLPQDVLSPGDALRIERAARDPDTWRTRPGRSTRPPADAGRPPAATSRPASARPVPAVTAPAATAGPARAAEAGEGISVQRWRRYGKDRLYASGPGGVRLGFLDVPTGEIHLELPDPTGEITRRLRAARTALG